MQLHLESGTQSKAGISGHRGRRHHRRNKTHIHRWDPWMVDAGGSSALHATKRRVVIHMDGFAFLTGVPKHLDGLQ